MTAEELWIKYCKQAKINSEEYVAWKFGASPDLLAKLVADGVKTATTSLSYWY